MKVEKPILINAGGEHANDSMGGYRVTEARHTGQGENKRVRDKRKTVYAGEWNQGNTLQERITAKKEQAQKQAMKVVGDAFSGDRAVDEDLESRRQHVAELKDERKTLQEETAGVAERRENLEKAYEAGDVSQADYLAEVKNLSREEQDYRAKLADNENTVQEENAVIRGTRLERLKHNPMGEAREQADAILEAAGEEVVGMAMEAAKEKIDKESEKREEQAEAIEEKREEQEKILEKRKERRQQAEELAESVPVAELVSADKLQDEVKQEVQNILDKMKLLAEDIKGAAVDESL